MAVTGKIVLLVSVLFVVFVAIKINSVLEVPPRPKFKDTWWGPGTQTNEDTSIKPFKINIPSEVIVDLMQRLEATRPFTPPLEGIQQQYGMNTNLLKEVIDFWKTKYNWREREKFLNKLTQFTTSVQGLQLHFIHVKPSVTSGVRVLPLLILHGWGGSIREFYDIIPLLTTPQEGRDFVFEVIAPSLPGFGFSQAAAKPGLSATQMAVVLKNLMKRLGFEKYYVQGGDWGGVIAAIMAAIYPEIVLGLHSNMCIVNTPLSHLKLLLGSFYPPLVVEKEYEERLYPLSKLYSNYLLELGYFHLQATKPDTLGVALKDSPVGLAAYMLEKFTIWTNPEWKDRADGGLTEKFSYTQLLDNIMIYWVTSSITTSMRIYADTMDKVQRGLAIERIPIEVPSACAKFKHELFYFPDSLLKDKFKQLVQSNDFPVGGHFAAFEEPALLAGDIWAAVDKFETINRRKKGDAI